MDVNRDYARSIIKLANEKLDRIRCREVFGSLGNDGTRYAELCQMRDDAMKDSQNFKPSGRRHIWWDVKEYWERELIQ